MSEWQPIGTAPKDRPFLGGYWRKGAWITEVIQWHKFSEDWNVFATVHGKYTRHDLTQASLITMNYAPTAKNRR